MNKQEFFSDVCTVIDEHADNMDEAVELLESLSEFRSDWLNTYSATGSLWLGAVWGTETVYLADGTNIEVPSKFLEYLRNEGHWEVVDENEVRGN